MASITERLGVPQGVEKVVLCFDFDQSKAAYPEGRGDPTGTEILIQVLKQRFLPDFFPIFCTVPSTGEYFQECLKTGVILDRQPLKLPIDSGGLGGGLEGANLPTFQIIAEVETIIERYARYSGLDRLQWRRVIVESIGFWVEIMSAFDEVVYLSGNAPHLFDDLIAYRVAQALGHPTLCLYRLPIMPRVSARLMIFEDVFRQDRPLPLPNGATPAGMGPDDLAEAMARFADPSIPQPKPMNTAKAPPKPALRPAPAGRLRGVMKKVQDRLFDKAKRRELVTAAGIWRDYRRHATHTLPDRFVYFPLHMQPEARSQPLGGIYADQELLVRHLVKALPEGVKLVVKEHSRQVTSLSGLATREPGFYARMAAEPRVVMLHHSVPTRDLLQRCLAAVTLTGTTALEALAVAKPCFVMGASPFVRAPNALVPRSQEELRDTLQRLHEGRIPPVERAQIAGYLDWLRAHSVFGYVDPYVHPRLEGLFSEGDNIAAVTAALCAAIDQVRTPRTPPPQADIPA